MKTFAIIKDGLVTNCIVASSLEAANNVVKSGEQCVEYIIPSIGDLYINDAFLKEPVVQSEVSWGMQ